MPGEVAKAHIARLYYDDGLTKREIAQRLGLSRFKVARLLDQAREEGIVLIEIHDPVEMENTLSRQLEDAYGLDLAVVVRKDAAIARAAAAWLPELLKDGDTLGVAWGTTLQGVGDALERPTGATIDVVQISGAIAGLAHGTHPTEVALRFAERLGGRLHSLPAPAVASAQARDELMDNAVIRPTIEMFNQVDLVIVGIGVGSELTEAPPGAAGYILVHVFDGDGGPLGAALTDHAIAMSRARLSETRVLAAAGGPTKHAAILGALRSGLINTLVTDAPTARHALKALE
jgi:DNA-binding transcriptional regulator LsrR (DeoR family)